METTIPEKSKLRRFSERFELPTLILQAIFLTRFVLLAVGLSSHPISQLIIGMTNPVIVPLNHLIPPIDIVRYIIEPASAIFGILIPFLFAIIALLTDFYRYKRKAVSERQLAEAQ
ncbi:MAG TPA: hypothetical protein VLA04_01870 [Verrucomicrobiae bacterium]|nr:hypothetical protein [Verrucomicrobiae bacterium]